MNRRTTALMICVGLLAWVHDATGVLPPPGQNAATDVRRPVPSAARLTLPSSTPHPAGTDLRTIHVLPAENRAEIGSRSIALAGLPDPCCGDTLVTQNSSASVTDPLPITGTTVSFENAFARCFSSAELPTEFHLRCVEFGIIENISPIGADFNVELRIVRLVQTPAFPTLSCPLPPLNSPAFGDPDLGQTWFDVPPEFEVLHLQTVTIPDQFSGLMKVILTRPVFIPTGADILVEVHAQSRLPSAGGDGGVFVLGSNQFAASGATLWWDGGGLSSYSDIVFLLPELTMQWVVQLEGTAGPLVPPANDCNGNFVPDMCDPDFNGNGIPDACEIPNQGPCCGDTGITQNNGITAAEPVLNCTSHNGTGTVENAWSRCFSGADFPTDFNLQCVEFGIFNNTSPIGQDFDMDLRISVLTPGCPPTGIIFGDPAAGQTWHDAPAAFNVLHVQTVTIPDGIAVVNQSSVLFQVLLSTPVTIPAGSDILFELHAPPRSPEYGGVDGGSFVAGANRAGAVGETFIWTPPCGITSYTPPTDIDPMMTQQWVVRLNGSFSSIPPPAVDCNNNNVPDECETDCNANGIPDDCDLDPTDPDGNGLVSLDCNVNGIPDECETDCNANGVPDDCDLDPTDPDGNGQVSLDCNANRIPDECDIATGTSLDCNANGIPDECDLAAGTSTDCNVNGIPDDCDVDPADPDGNGQISADCQSDLIPDECQVVSFQYTLDDGTGELDSGLPNGGNLGWMNRFNVRAGAETINSISVVWGTVANGTPAVVYLWNDPNGDGDPTDAQVLASAATTVQLAATNTFIPVDIPGTFVGPAGTSFFVGAIITYQAGEKPVPVDTSNPALRSWIFGDEVNPIDPNNLAAAAVPPLVATTSNVLVRGMTLGDDCNLNILPDRCEGADDVATFVGQVILPDPLLTCIFDGNGDGAINGLDIQPFVDRLLAGP